MTENPSTIAFLRAALETIRRAGNDSNPQAIWMQKIAAHALFPEQWPLPDAPQRDSHGWCDVCKAPPAAPCYHWCRYSSSNRQPEAAERMPGTDGIAHHFCLWLDDYQKLRNYRPDIGDAYDAAFRTAWKRPPLPQAPQVLQRIKHVGNLCAREGCKNLVSNPVLAYCREHDRPPVPHA